MKTIECDRCGHIVDLREENWQGVQTRIITDIYGDYVLCDKCVLDFIDFWNRGKE